MIASMTIAAVVAASFLIALVYTTRAKNKDHDNTTGDEPTPVGGKPMSYYPKSKTRRCML